MQIVGIQLRLPMMLKHILVVPEPNIRPRLCHKLAIYLIFLVNIIIVRRVLLVFYLYQLPFLLVIRALCLQIEPGLVIDIQLLVSGVLPLILDFSDFFELAVESVVQWNQVVGFPLSCTFSGAEASGQFDHIALDIFVNNLIKGSVCIHELPIDGMILTYRFRGKLLSQRVLLDPSSD